MVSLVWGRLFWVGPRYWLYIYSSGAVSVLRTCENEFIKHCFTAGLSVRLWAARDTRRTPLGLGWAKGNWFSLVYRESYCRDDCIVLWIKFCLEAAVILLKRILKDKGKTRDWFSPFLVIHWHVFPLQRTPKESRSMGSALMNLDS